LYPAPRPLTVGEVLDLSFRIYRRTFVKCLIFGALTVLANWLPNLYSLLRGQSVVNSVVTPTVDAGRVVLALVAVLLALVFPVAILLRQYRIITGERVGGEFTRAVRLLGRTVLISILVTLALLASLLCTLPAFLVSGMQRYLLLSVLVLPAVYVLIRLVCAFPAMVIENSGAAQSLERSWQLTAGSVLRLIAIYTVAFFLLMVLYVVFGSVTTFLYAVLGRGDVALIAAAVGVVLVAVGALASPYYSALGIAVFGDLVARKEGADLSQRISVA
jgi:membrane-anchored glycerophosphoryl diester phosphodiesterase (GDPDase)